MTRISVRCLGALPTFPAWLHSLPTSPTCYPAQRLDFCCSRRISQEATPASGVPRSVAWIPWCHCCLPHANRSDTVTELAYHTERLLAGQLHRPLSPCPWPEHRVGAKSQHGKPHALYSLIEPPAAHITRIYVPCAWGFTPQFWCWSETVSKFSEKCWYHNLVWSRGYFRVITMPCTKPVCLPQICPLCHSRYTAFPSCPSSYVCLWE